MSENIYYNINIRNDGTTLSTAPIQARYYEERLQPFITHPEQYEMKIIKFSIPCSEIPILIADMKLFDTGFTNRTVWKIGFKKAGIVHTRYVIYVSEQPLLQPSVATGVAIPNINYRYNKYYWIYSYQHMIEMINDTLNIAMLDFPLIDRKPVPYLIYDATTQLISIIVDKTFDFDIVMNTEMQAFFQGFDFDFFGHDRPNGDDYLLIYTDIADADYNKPNIAPIYPPPYVKIEQNFISMIYWYSLQNLTITSATLPIINEYISSVSTASGNNSSPVITEFTPDLSSTSTPRSILNFYDNGASRFISMRHAPDVKKMDIAVYWQDKFGLIYPLEIPIHQSVSVKFLFRKKLKYREEKGDSV